MKIVFISAYFSHHQKPFSEAMYNLLDNQFSYIETSKMSEERLKLGYKPETASYVRSVDEQTSMLIEDAEIAIFGGAPRNLIDSRLNKNKIVFFYSERIYKSGYDIWKFPARLITFWKNYGKYKNLYMLCSSAYTAFDYARHFTFLNKTYKWGYFPETKKYDIDDLVKSKRKNVILWCGRFLDWKHPDDAIKIAKRLKDDGYSFDFRIIGTGQMEESLKNMISKYQLQDYVHMLGSMTPEQVRENMEEAGIYVFTSDFNEGWGSVLNESMNSGCAVVASHAIGSVPFLIKNNENGLIYKNGDLDSLYNKVKYLIDNPDKQEVFGKNAYHTIVDLWNAEVAAQRFLKFSEEIEKYGYCDLYDDGPCSRAEVIKNDWFRE